MTEYRTISRETVDAVWSTICRRLDENVTKINSELEKDRLHLDIGSITGIVEVREYGKTNAVSFELAMNTGGLQVWYQEGMIRWDQPVYAVKDKNTDTLLYHYQGEPVAVEELVDRVFKVWLEKKWKLLGK